MATAHPDTADTETECSVCHELFKDPKLLPCAHVLCRGCLLSWLSSSSQPHCPVCRATLSPPQQQSKGQGGPEQLLHSLPDDVAMASLVHSVRVLQQDTPCGGCRKATAAYTCLHCGDLLCQACTETHSNLKATRNHRVQVLSSLTAEQLSAKQPAMCPAHGDKLSELYCDTHTAAFCSLCANTQHRSCPRLVPFDQHVAQLREQLSTISSTLRAAEEALDDASRRLDQHEEKAEQEMKRSLQEISKACDQLERMVKQCRSRLETQARSGKDKVQQSVAAAKEVLSKRRGQVISNRRFVDRVKDSSPPGLLGGIIATIKTQVSELDLTTALDDDIAAMTTVSIDTLALEQMRGKLATLGQLQCLPASPSQADVWRFQTNDLVQFTNGGVTVEKKGQGTVILISESPMKADTLYEVQLEAVEETQHDYLYLPCGVVNSVDGLDIPETVIDGWKDAIVFSYSVFVNGEKKPFDVKDGLKDLKQGTRVGLCRKSNGNLHLYINGKKQAVHVRNVPSAVHVFFELMFIYRKMTTLPLTATIKA